MNFLEAEVTSQYRKYILYMNYILEHEICHFLIFSYENNLDNSFNPVSETLTGLNNLNDLMGLTNFTNFTNFTAFINFTDFTDLTF